MISNIAGRRARLPALWSLRSYSTTLNGRPLATRHRKNNHSWPETQLAEACRSGHISTTTATAIAFLEDFVSAKPEQHKQLTIIKKLLEKHSLSPRVLSELGVFFNRIHSRKRPARAIEQALYRAGAELHDEYAVSAIVDRALRSKKPRDPDLPAALTALNELSAKGSVTALERLAAVSELRGDIEQARAQAKSFLSARRPATSDVNTLPSHPPQRRAWQIIANSSKDLGELEAVLETGARDFDDPKAYFQLAALPSTSSEQHVKFLLKAASSGDSDAAYALGMIIHDAALGNLKEIQSLAALGFLLGSRHAKARVPKTVTLSLAAEWFRVALEAARADDHVLREKAARGAIAAMLAMGDNEGCRDLLTDHAGSEWAKRMVLSERPVQET